MTRMADDNVIEAEFSQKDLEDLEMLNSEEPSYHTILQVWREVLKPAAAEASNRVTAGWAAKMVATYSGIEFNQMTEFRDRYYAKLAQLVEILNREIASDDDALTYASPEEDAEENAHHYKNLLLQWQQTILQWELDWDCTDEFAGVELGTISEVHKMFFGQTGLTAFLDNIKFEFTEDDQASLAEALEELRAGANSE